MWHCWDEHKTCAIDHYEQFLYELEIHETIVTAENILQFVSGSMSIPAGGFSLQLTLNIDNDISLPMASTCSVYLTLQTKYSNYKD